MVDIFHGYATFEIQPDEAERLLRAEVRGLAPTPSSFEICLAQPDASGG